MAKKQLTPKSLDMSKWYTQVIQQAKLADYSPVKGCMVIRPNGFAIWENMHAILDSYLKKLDIENAYFPLFIPLSFLSREAEHVEGFAPELAIVTHGGGEELEEKLVVRPTSETIMYEMYSQWVQSHRDLPILLNQWNNVVRWEKRTYFFLRTTEFLWQEAHTAHATHEEAWQMVLDGLESYRKLVEENLAIPVVRGKKSEREKFAGADVTTTIEALMPDGKALQAGTSHDLGQNFSKKSAFNITFQDENGQAAYAWQTSFGLSTRTIGALIMTHGDDDGLVIPPKVAKIQVAIIPTDWQGLVMQSASELHAELQTLGVRSKIHTDSEHRMGWHLNEAEIQGIPLVIVVGAREMEKGTLSVTIRHTKEKRELQRTTIAKEVPQILSSIQTELFQNAQKRVELLTTTTESYDEFKKTMSSKRGFIRAFWCERAECEDQIKEETKATTRCLPFTDDKGSVAEESGQCIKCGTSCNHRWLFAQAY